MVAPAPSRARAPLPVSARFVKMVVSWWMATKMSVACADLAAILLTPMAVALEPLIVFALLVLTWQAVRPLLPVLLLLTASAQVVLLVLSWWRVLWILAMIVKFAALRLTTTEAVRARTTASVLHVPALQIV